MSPSIFKQSKDIEEKNQIQYNKNATTSDILPKVTHVKDTCNEHDDSYKSKHAQKNKKNKKSKKNKKNKKIDEIDLLYHNNIPIVPKGKYTFLVSEEEKIRWLNGSNYIKLGYTQPESDNEIRYGNKAFMQQELERKLAAKAEKDKLETIDLKQNDSFIDSTQFVSLEKNYMNDSNNFNSTISQNVKLELIKDESNTANIIQNDSSKIIQDGNSILVNDDERSKWLTELKKRGPRLRQPTLNILNYRGNQTFIKEEPDERIITVEKKEQGTFNTENNKDIDVKSKKELNKIDINVKPSINSEQSNFNDNFQDNLNKASNSEINNQFIDIELTKKQISTKKVTFDEKKNEVYVYENINSKIINELKKKEPELVVQDSFSVSNISIEENFKKDKSEEKIVTVDKEEIQIQEIINSEHIQSTVKEKKGKVENLVDFFSNLDKNAKIDYCNKLNLDKIQTFKNENYLEIEKRKVQKNKNDINYNFLQERTFSFKELMNKWNKK